MSARASFEHLRKADFRQLPLLVSASNIRTRNDAYSVCESTTTPFLPKGYVVWVVRAGVAKLVDASDLNAIECPWGNPWSRTAQSRGNLHWQSRAKPPSREEGVETRRAAPTAPAKVKG